MGRTAKTITPNRTLESIKVAIHNHYHAVQTRDGIVTVEKLKNTFLGLEDSYEIVLQLFEKHNSIFV
jgi:hypothetical protein